MTKTAVAKFIKFLKNFLSDGQIVQLDQENTKVWSGDDKIGCDQVFNCHWSVSKSVNHSDLEFEDTEWSQP